MTSHHPLAVRMRMRARGCAYQTLSCEDEEMVCEWPEEVELHDEDMETMEADEEPVTVALVAPIVPEDADEEEDEDDEEEGEGPATVGTPVVMAAGFPLTAEEDEEGAGSAKTGRLEVIHGWARMSSRRRRSAAWNWRQRWIRSWHSRVRRLRNLIWAERICSSCSKGMSPHTMS